MSQERQNTSPEQNNTQEQAQNKEPVDPRGLVIKPDYIVDKDPQEVVRDNPAVTPQMLNEPSDDRGDLSRE